MSLFTDNHRDNEPGNAGLQILAPWSQVVEQATQTRVLSPVSVQRLRRCLTCQAWLILWLLFAIALPQPVTGQVQTNPFLNPQTPMGTPANQIQVPNTGYAGSINPGVYGTSGIPTPAVQTGLQPGVNFSVPQANGYNAGTTGIATPGIPQTLPGLQMPAANSAIPNYATQGYADPFTAGNTPYGYVPPGYPNLPAASSTGGWFSAGSTPTNGAALFGQPQTPTYGPITGYQNPGVLNNPQAYGEQTFSSQSWQRFWQQSDWQRLVHAFRMRHTYTDGGGPATVQANDTEIATSLSFPNWLHSGMPITISPGFISHAWQGPHSGTGADLPGSAYSAYLQLDHSTPLNQQFGGEVSFTTGVYSSYDTMTSDSVRFTGTGLGWIRLTPKLTFKLGIEYLDRVEVKMLPAGGLFWTPDANTRFNIYFPRPKLARRLPNFGNTEVWWYVAAEYGGGSWTVKREANFSDQVDINDYRLMLGLEGIGLRGITGFGEIGYAFDRELVYRSSEPIDYDLGDAFFVRAGFAF